MTMQTAGFVGLGKMGGHMARRLVNAGHKLTILDLNEELPLMRPLTAPGSRPVPRENPRRGSAAGPTAAWRGSCRSRRH